MSIRRGFSLRVLIALVSFSGAAIAGAPDFSTSRAEFDPSRPVAGDLVRYSFIVTNSGSASPYTRVGTTFPGGYLIKSEGDCRSGEYDREAGRLLWHEGAFAAGSTKTCTVQVLTRRRASGTYAAVTTEIFTAMTGVDAPEGGTSVHLLEAKPELMAEPTPEAIRIGPIGVTPAGFLVLGFLGLLIGGLVVLARQSRRPKTTRSRRPAHASYQPMAASTWVGIVGALGLLAAFVAIGYGDWRANTVFHETECTILDSAIEAVRSSRPARLSYTPVFVVRYDVLGRQTYSSGYGSFSSLMSGSKEPSRRILEQLAIGSRHPCWYDPDDPKTVFLNRSPGGAYGFALLPLLVLALGCYLYRTSAGRR